MIYYHSIPIVVLNIEQPFFLITYLQTEVSGLSLWRKLGQNWMETLIKQLVDLAMKFSNSYMALLQSYIIRIQPAGWLLKTSSQLLLMLINKITLSTPLFLEMEMIPNQMVLASQRVTPIHYLVPISLKIAMVQNLKDSLWWEILMEMMLSTLVLGETRTLFGKIR